MEQCNTLNIKFSNSQLNKEASWHILQNAFPFSHISLDVQKSLIVTNGIFTDDFS